MAKQAQINEVRPVLEAADSALDKVEGFLDSLDKVADKSTNVVEAGLEKVADVVPDVLDTSVHVTTEGTRKVLRFFRSPKHAAIAVVLASAAAGAGLGVVAYFATVKHVKSKLQKEFDEKLESEIAEMRRFYARRNKDGEFATPQAAVEKLLTKEAAEALKTYRGEGGEPQNIVVTGEPEVNLDSEQKEHLEHTNASVVDEATPEQVAALRDRLKNGPVEVERTSHNIFVDGSPVEDFDYAAEVPRRTPDEPYVITHQEFMENENGWEQSNLTYYNGDDVLADSGDVIIPDIEGIVGSDSLTKFGYGSQDPRIVYVRNERIETDFEVALSDGKYSEEVAGLRHSAPIRRFRRGDDE